MATYTTGQEVFRRDVGATYTTGEEVFRQEVMPVAEQEHVEWWDAWGQLKRAGAQLDTAVASLRANESFALGRPNLAPEFKTRMAEVETLRDRAVWLRDTIKSAMGYFGVQLEGLGQLGIVPWLVWPVVAGSVAWLSNKALDMYQFAQLVEEQRRLEQGGMPPAQAAAVVQSKAEAGTLTGAFKALTPVLVVGAIGVGAWIVYKQSGRRRRRGR